MPDRQQYVVQHTARLAAADSLGGQQILQLVTNRLDPQRIEHEEHGVGVDEKPKRRRAQVPGLHVLAGHVPQHQVAPDVMPDADAENQRLPLQRRLRVHSRGGRDESALHEQRRLIVRGIRRGRGSRRGFH